MGILFFLLPFIALILMVSTSFLLNLVVDQKLPTFVGIPLAIVMWAGFFSMIFQVVFQEIKV